ncbi:P22 coat protein [compost metagenome]
MRASTEQGIELVMQKWYDINTMKIKYRLDTLFGVCNKQPEMTGILIFGQA